MAFQRKEGPFPAIFAPKRSLEHRLPTTSFRAFNLDKPGSQLPPKLPPGLQDTVDSSQETAKQPPQFVTLRTPEKENAVGPSVPKISPFVVGPTITINQLLAPETEPQVPRPTLKPAHADTPKPVLPQPLKSSLKKRQSARSARTLTSRKSVSICEDPSVHMVESWKHLNVHSGEPAEKARRDRSLCAIF